MYTHKRVVLYKGLPWGNQYLQPYAQKRNGAAIEQFLVFISRSSILVDQEMSKIRVLPKETHDFPASPNECMDFANRPKHLWISRVAHEIYELCLSSEKCMDLRAC